MVHSFQETNRDYIIEYEVLKDNFYLITPIILDDKYRADKAKIIISILSQQNRLPHLKQGNPLIVVS